MDSSDYYRQEHKGKLGTFFFIVILLCFLWYHIQLKHSIRWCFYHCNKQTQYTVLMWWSPKLSDIHFRWNSLLIMAKITTCIWRTIVNRGRGSTFSWGRVDFAFFANTDEKYSLIRFISITCTLKTKVTHAVKYTVWYNKYYVNVIGSLSVGAQSAKYVNLRRICILLE